MKIWKQLQGTKAKKRTAEDAENSPKLKKVEKQIRQTLPDFKIHVTARNLYSFYYDVTFTNLHGCKEQTFGNTPRLKSISDVIEYMNYYLDK